MKYCIRLSSSLLLMSFMWAAAEPETQLTIRMILVSSRPEAEEVIGRLGTGEDFSELARNLSRHRASSPHGGRLGIIALGDLRPEIRKAVEDLQPGAVSSIVPLDGQFLRFSTSNRLHRDRVARR